MAGATMLVHVTHIDDSIQGRQGPCMLFWGMTHDRSLYLLMEKYLESIRHYLEASTPPLDLNVVDQVCCVLINHQWHRARILDPKLSHAGTVEVFCIDSGDNHSVPLAFVRTLDFPGHEVEHIREWPPLASKFILADIIAPRGPGSRTQWSEPAMMFLKIHVENRTWKAAPMGMYGENQGVRLFNSSNQLLATVMIQQGLGIASQTYHEALHTRDGTEKPPAYMKPALTIGQMGGNGPIVNNRLPPAFAIPSTYRDQHPAFAMAASYSPYQSPVPPRAFVTNDIPQKGRHDVIVTCIPDGPQKFYVQLKSEAKDLQSLRKKLDSIVPHPLHGKPQPGTPCIAVSSADKLFHRGLITAVRECGNQYNCSVYFADIGTQELVSLTLICNIPDDLLLLRIFAYRVSLFGVEEVSKLTGLNEIFTALVKSTASLQIEVVEDDERNQKVNLYDADGRSFREVLVSIYSNFLTSKSQTNATSPSTAQSSTVVTTCVTDIAPVQLAVEESLRVNYAEESGCFFGQFEKTPVKSLHEMATELMTTYSSNPNSALLYADVMSHLGHYGVFLWEEDYKFYRVRITKEMVNDAEIHFIDYGNFLVVPRCKILAPLESLTRFYHPPYGIRCRLEGEVTLSASEWTTAILDKSIKVQIGECDNGIYSVTLTKDPCNEDVVKLVSKKVAPICSVVKSTPAFGIRSSSPQTVAGQLIPRAEPQRPKDDRRKRNGDNGNFGTIHYQHPNAKDSNWRSTGTEEGSPSVQIKPSNKETNWRTSANPIQEIIRAPRGPPPSTGNGETKGPVGFQRLGSTDQSQPPVVKPINEPPPTFPAIPKPVTPIPVQKQLSYPMQILPGVNKPVEMVCVVDPSSFFVRLCEDSSLLADMIAKLNAVYSDEPQPFIQNVKADSACVVQYIEDNLWYRGKILESNDSSLTIPQVKVLFVDYGNIQLCPPEQVKYIDEAFVQQPPLVFHCKLKDVERSWTDEDVAKFNASSMFKTLSATFTACDSDGKLPIRLIVEDEGVTTVINDLFGAKTSVPPPIDEYTYLPVSETPVEMTIAWYHNPGRIFISPVDLTSYQNILDELEQFYSSMPPDELAEDKPKIGLPCVARFTEDQRYYRSRILTIQDDMAKVLFVDYGNEQDTPLSQLKRIVPRFMVFPQLTLHSKLKGVKKLASGPLNPDPQKHIAACFSIGQTLSALFHPVAQDNNGVFEVDLIVPGIGDVAQYLIKEKILDCISSEIHAELAVQIMNFTEGQIISTHAVAPHVNSATEFWVHFDPESVEAFMERIDVLALDPKFINDKDYNATVGKSCLAYFADDGRWYRAIVESVEGNSATVFYVDYGNSCIVNTSDLRALPVDVSQQPAFAYKCCVDGAETFTEEIAMAFQTSIIELAFTVQCVNVIEGTLKVRLYSNDGVDLIEQLCNAHLNQPTIEQLPVENVIDVVVPTTETLGEVIAEETVHVTCPVIEEDLNQNVSVTPEALSLESDLKEQMDHVKVYISYSISPNQFWLQLRQNDSKLSEMLDDITKIYQTDKESFLIQGQPVIDQIYGVYHPSYGDWYRGRVKGISETIAEVHFVDYGDTYSVPIGDILELPQQFSNIPAMAIEASLSLESPEAVAEKFNAICFEPDQIHSALFATDENGLQFVKSIFIGDTNVLDLITIQEEPVIAHYKINLSTIPEALMEQSVQTTCADDTNMDVVRPEDVSFSSALEAEVKIEDNSSVELNEIPPLDLNVAPGQRISSCASISYIESAADIWLQLDPTAVDNLMNEIAAVYPSTLAAAKPVVGNHCLALFPVDGQWHRAVITRTDMGSDEVRVNYVDYGHSSIVNVGDLRMLPVHFAERPVLALKCALDGIEGNVISSPSTEQCMSVLEEEVLTVVFSSSTRDRVYVRVFDVTGSDLNEKLGLPETFKIDLVGTNLLEFTHPDDVEMASPLRKPVEPAVFNLVTGQSVVPPEVVTQSAMAGDATAGCLAICNAELVDGAQQVYEETEVLLHDTERHENETEVMDRLQSALVENVGESLTLAAGELENQEAKVVCNTVENAVKENDLAGSCIQVAVGFEEDLEGPIVNVVQETVVEEEHFGASLVLVVAEDSENQETEVVAARETSVTDIDQSPIQVSVGYSEIEQVETADNVQQVVIIENDFAENFSHIDSFISGATLEQQVELKENEVREQLTILEQEMACAESGTLIDMQETSNHTITESINLEQNAPLSGDALVPCPITFSTNLHPSEELPVIEDSALFELETTEKVGTSIPTDELIVHTNINKDVEENLFDEQIVARIKSEVLSEEDDQVPKGNAYVSHVVSPGDFWIQKIEHADVIGDVDNQLLDMNLDSHELVNQFVVGNFYAAKHHYYGYWYRAKLLKIEDALAEVIFIDYGDMQTIPTLDIRHLPPMLEDVAPMALHCKLAALHLDCWPEKTTKVMKNSCQPEDICRATFRDEVDGIVEVESLFLGDFDVARAVLSSLVCDHSDGSSQQPHQEPISPQQGVTYSETSQLDAHLFLIRVEPGTEKTSRHLVEGETSLPID